MSFGHFDQAPQLPPCSSKDSHIVLDLFFRVAPRLSKQARLARTEDRRRAAISSDYQQAALLVGEGRQRGIEALHTVCMMSRCLSVLVIHPVASASQFPDGEDHDHFHMCLEDITCILQRAHLLYVKAFLLRGPDSASYSRSYSCPLNCDDIYHAWNKK